MDDHLEVRHPRHIRGGDDCQGGSVAVVSTQDSPVQERQRSKLPSQVCFVPFYYIAPAIFFSSYFKSGIVKDFFPRITASYFKFIFDILARPINHR